MDLFIESRQKANGVDPGARMSLPSVSRRLIRTCRPGELSRVSTREPLPDVVLGFGGQIRVDYVEWTDSTAWPMISFKVVDSGEILFSRGLKSRLDADEMVSMCFG
jgi:hypothetical protein